VSTDGRMIARALQRAAQLRSEPLADIPGALELCRLIIQRWPDEVPAEDALQLLVRLRQASDDDGLLAELDQLAAQLQSHEVSGFALLYAAQWAERHDQPAQAVARYDTLADRFPRGPLFDDALMAAARLLRKLSRGAEAAARLERLEKTFSSAII